MEKYDVIVVGGGPAGLSAAKTVAKRGRRVLCIEKKNEIGNPVRCGEAVSDYVLDRMPFEIPSEFLEWRIDGLSFKYDNIEVVKRGKEWSGYSIDRRKVEEWLAKNAEEAGVDLLTNTEVIDVFYKKGIGIKEVMVRKKCGKCRFRAEYFIAADGYPSLVLEKMGVCNKMSNGHLNVYSWELSNMNLSESNLEQFYFGGYIPNTFGYVFPKNENSANVGVASLSPNINLKKCFDKLIKNRWLKNQTKNSIRIVEKSKIAPFRDPKTRYNYDNLFVVGDAANQNIKPFVEGFIPAIICGTILGRIIGTDKEMEYERLVDKKIPFIKKSKIIMDCVYKAMGIKRRKKYLLLLGLMSNSFSAMEFDKMVLLRDWELTEKILKSA
ncbi:MAG: NAD(P)/FAD-dependent oxidoreductase [Candidatus Micrarchaeia archaeon]